MTRRCVLIQGTQCMALRCTNYTIFLLARISFQFGRTRRKFPLFQHRALMLEPGRRNRSFRRARCCTRAGDSQVYGVVWNPFVPWQFVTYGARHLRTWTPEQCSLDAHHAPTRWRCRAGVFNICPVHVRSPRPARRYPARAPPAHAPLHPATMQPTATRTKRSAFASPATLPRQTSYLCWGVQSPLLSLRSFCVVLMVAGMHRHAPGFR